MMCSTAQGAESSKQIITNNNTKTIAQPTQLPTHTHTTPHRTMSGTYADPDWANPGETTGGEVTESVPAASGNAAKQPTAG